MENECIYVITTFETWPKNYNPWEVGCARSPGYYFSLAEAENAVTNNRCDIWETCYHYACITRLDPGLYTTGVDRYYKFNREIGKYEFIEERERFGFGVCGIG